MAGRDLRVETGTLFLHSPTDSPSARVAIGRGSSTGSPQSVKEGAVRAPLGPTTAGGMGTIQMIAC